MNNLVQAGTAEAEGIDPTIKKVLKKHGLNVALGDVFIRRDGCVVRVEAFIWKPLHYQEGPRDVLHIKTVSSWNGSDWHSYGTSTVDEFARQTRGEAPEYVKLHASLEDLEARSVEEMLSLEQEYLKQGEQQATAGTSLTLRHSKEHLETLRDSVDEKRFRIIATQRMIERKVRRMQALAEGLYKQLKYITKIIEVGELYLGVREQIYHLREGQPAPVDTPITFHQLVLYMDEEVGDIVWRDGQQGIDFRSIEEFDKWLLKDNHLGILLPEPKGIVFLRVSRQERRYSDDPFFNAKIDAENKHSYALIKNGENVYRIWTALPLGTRFFPSNKEWALIQAGEEESIHPLTGEKRTHKTDTEAQEFSYKRNMAFLQGLIDRTEVFWPMPRAVNLFDLDSYEGLVHLVRDDEPSLTSGRISYDEWKKDLNSRIGRGSRIYLTRIPWEYQGKDSHYGRFLTYQQHYPPFPSPGVYTVEEVGKWGRYSDHEQFRILYNPGDTVYGSWGEYDPHERKKRVSFLLNAHDPFVLNYDGLDINDIEYYIGHRRERRHYLKMLPVLHGIRKALLEERAYEQEFIRLLHERDGYAVEAINEAVQWWKLKNIWKRPIGKDDAKAWRMIRRRLNRQQGSE